MNIRNRLQMQFDFIPPKKITKPVQNQGKSFQSKPKPVEIQKKPLVTPTTTPGYVCSCVKYRTKIEVHEQIIDQIEQQVKQQQEIVHEWDKQLELMRTRDIEMQRTDVISELNYLITKTHKPEQIRIQNILSLKVIICSNSNNENYSYRKCWVYWQPFDHTIAD